MSAWISLREGRRLLGVAAGTAIPVSKGRMSHPALSVVFWLLLALSAVFRLTLLLLPIPDFGDIEGPMIPSLPLSVSLSVFTGGYVAKSLISMPRGRTSWKRLPGRRKKGYFLSYLSTDLWLWIRDVPTL